MPNIRTLLTTLTAVAAVAGAAGFAVGRVQGGAAPDRRRPAPPAAAPEARPPVFPVASEVLAPFGWNRTLADLDPALAGADRELDALAAEVAKAEAVALADGAGVLAPSFAAFGGAPGRTCFRSVEIISTGDGKPRRVVSRTWGNCGGVSAGTKAPSGRETPTPTELQDL